MTSVTVEETIEREQKTFDAAMEDLAERFRGELLIPVCSKHHFTYIAGNGTWVLTRKEGDEDEISISSIFDLRSLHVGRREERVLLAALEDIVRTLDIEVRHNNAFGFYVADVDRGDWI